MPFDEAAERERNESVEAEAGRWTSRFEADNPYAKRAVEKLRLLGGNGGPYQASETRRNFAAEAQAYATLAIAFERWRATE